MTIKRTQLFIATFLMLTTALVGAATFTYDFESLNTGSLAGQDGWLISIPTHNNPVVVAGPGAGNTTRVLQGILNSSNSISCRRYLQQPFLFDASNPMGSISFWARAGGTGVGDFVSGGLEFNGYILPTFGITFNSGDAAPKSFIRVATTGTLSYGASLVIDHWYEIKLDLDFSVSGGRGSLSYRDVTANQVGFTSDPALQNILLLITTNPEGRYLASSIGFRLGQNTSGDTFYLDNISATGPSLPTTYTAVSDPFTDGNLINGTDPLDISWTNDSVTSILVANDAVIGQGDALKVNVPNTSFGGACFGFSPIAAILGNEVGSFIKLRFDVRADVTTHDPTGLRFGLYQSAFSANAYPATGGTNYYDNSYDGGYFALTATGSSNLVNILAEANTNDATGCKNGVRTLTTIGTDIAASLTNDTSSHTIQLTLERSTEGASGTIRLTLRFDGTVRCIRDDATPIARIFNLIMIRGNAADQDFTIDNVSLTSSRRGTILFVM